MSSHLQSLAEHRRRADKRVAMNLPVANEFRLFESRNQTKHALLLAEFQMVLKANEVITVGHQILLPELHHCPGLPLGARIAQANRFHRSVAQGVAAAASDLFDRQTSLEVHRLLEFVKRHRLRRDERVVETIVFLFVEGAVQVIVSTFAVTRRAKRY